MNDQAIEQEIQAKGLTAPRITPADIEANIAYEGYFTAQHGVSGAMDELQLHQRTPIPGPHGRSLAMVTICVLITKNGTKLVGVNTGPVSPDNFDAELGRKLARQDAVEQLWPMLGYELRSKLAG